jgi:hypothetical protein
VIVIAVLLGCGGLPAGGAARPAITGPPRPVPAPAPSPSPAAGTFAGTITSATGRYAGDHGHVVIQDGPMASHRSGRLLISGRACHRARHCVALSGMPPGSLTLRGHTIPDAGFTYTVRAAGRVRPLGDVSISGLLQIPGFFACRHQTITLTLAAAHGTVTVAAATPTRCVGGPPD